MKKVLFLMLLFRSLAVGAQCDVADYQIHYCSNESRIDLTAFEPDLDGNFEYYLNDVLVFLPSEYFISHGSVLVVLFIETGAACSSLFTITLEELIAPEINIVVSGEISCISTHANVLSTSMETPEVIYSWYYNDIFIDNGLNLLVEQPGYYKLVAEHTINGCVSIDSIEVESNIQFPTAEIDTTLNCDGTVTIMVEVVYPEHNDYTLTWTGPGIIDSSEVNPTINEPGDYVLTISDNITSCVGVMPIFIKISDCIGVGNEETLGKEEIKIYPNPFSNRFAIDGVELNSKLHLYNHAGKLIQRVSQKSGFQNLDLLPSGVYYLLYEHGAHSEIFSIVKQ